jgi:flagellar motor protein MotB
LRLWNRNPAPSPDEPSPAAIATPSGDSIFFPNDYASETPAAAPSSSVARWRSALGGIDGIEVRDINQVPRVVFTEPVFSRLTSIDADQKPRLKRVAEAIHAAEPSAMLVVIGHTDNDPVRPNSTYQSNEHLGRLRAQAVTKFLSENAPLPEHQLRDSSQGDQNPPFSNASAADKVRNRTVTLEIISPQ